MKKKDGLPQICISIVSKCYKELEEDICCILTQPYDCVEWRLDCIEDFTDLERMAEKIKTSFSCPLIATVRSVQHGGKGDFSQCKSLYSFLIENRYAEYIDLELDQNIETLADFAHAHGVLVIGSYHCLDHALKRENICDLYHHANSFHCDIFKVASFPHCLQEVVDQMLVTWELSLKNQMKLISVCMGETGKISRIIGGMFGSVLTFASSNKKSAPGQIEASLLWQYLQLFN